MEDLQNWGPGTENGKKLQQAFAKIMANYSEELKILAGESFQQDIEALSKKYDGDATSKAFHDEVLSIRLKHAPRLAEMDKEMAEATKELGAPHMA